jgi:thiosulfate/3-mercaptopyruvate sulfurtransferase
MRPSQLAARYSFANRLIASAFLLLLAFRANAGPFPSVDPWPSSQTVQPADLVRELADKSKEPPTIVYVGFRALFAGAHIPGASFHGTASSEEGLAELKKWAATRPRSTNLVIYCGCCPFEKCPNIRPAYAALHDLGFTQLRVLVLSTSFAKDWVEKDYPYEKGS